MRRRSRFACPLVLLLLGVTSALSCSFGKDEPSISRWATLAPPGFDVGDSYRLDLAAASQSTPVADGQTLDALRQQRYLSGEAQVFTSGRSFAIISEYRFPSADHAARFQTFQVSTLRGLGSVAVFGTTRVPGGTTYVLHAPTRSRGREVFCEGVVFGMAEAVYLVSRCGPYPGSAETAESLAARVNDVVG